MTLQIAEGKGFTLLIVEIDWRYREWGIDQNTVDLG